MFVSKKVLKNNNRVLMQQNSELNSFCVNLQRINKELVDETVVLGNKLEEKTKECKRLKQLLTKNKISYKKEN